MYVSVDISATDMIYSIVHSAYTEKGMISPHHMHRRSMDEYMSTDAIREKSVTGYPQ